MGKPCSFSSFRQCNGNKPGNFVGMRREKKDRQSVRALDFSKGEQNKV